MYISAMKCNRNGAMRRWLYILYMYIYIYVHMLSFIMIHTEVHRFLTGETSFDTASEVKFPVEFQTYIYIYIYTHIFFLCKFVY